MDGSKPPSISPQDLYTASGTAAAPVLIDVRRSAAFAADNRMIVGALRRNPDELQNWLPELPAGRAVVVYCVDGHEASKEAASALQRAGVGASYLEHGIAGWAEHRLPMRGKRDTEPCSWVTRERPKIDRIACPWLIRRFIDPAAEFLFAPTERVFAVAEETGATAYDIPGAEPFSHDGELCSFDAFLKVYGIKDPALLELTPQSPGLLALSLGLSANFPDDHAMLEHGMVMYDAFYA